MRRALAPFCVLLLAGCHDFDATYAQCVQSGRCEAPDAATVLPDGGVTDAGPRSDAGLPGVVASPGASFVTGGAVAAWESPLPSGLQLRAAWAASQSEAWFVGNAGSVAHLSGGVLTGFILDAGLLSGVAGDGARVLAVGEDGVWDVLTGEHVLPLAFDSRRSVLALGDGGFLIGGAPDGVPVVLRYDPATKQLVELQRATGFSGAVRACARGPAGLVCAVGGADDGALLRSGNDGVSWSVEVADAGSVYAVTTDALGTPWAGGRAGLGTRAASGDWAWWPTSSSWPVSLATGRDFVSVLLDSAEGLRCTSPSSCLTVASGYPGGLEATTASGDVAWFVGGQGAIFQVTSDGGRQLNDTREATVRDLFVEADGGAWAAVTLDSSHGEVWRRTLAGWQVEATLPSEVSSVARVSGTLVVGTAEGVWQQLPNGQFHVSNMPGGAGFILKVRPVGAGGLAVGSVTLSLDGGAWVLERPADWVPGMVLRDVLAFDDGSALVVGRDGDSRGLVLSRSAAGVTVVVDAGIPLAAELMAATRLADGGVFACGYAGFSVEGSSQGGFRALAHDVLTSCNGAWAAPDDSLYVTTPAGVQRVVHGPLNPNQLETTGDYRLNDTLCLPIVPFGDRLLVGGAWASIFTLKP